jgi:hypothetical protein
MHMAGLPGVEQRTFTAAFQRALDATPDAIAELTRFLSNGCRTSWSPSIWT